MEIHIRDSALESRLRRQMEATGTSDAEETLARILQTQEEQDRWLQENSEMVNAKIRLGLEQLERGEGIPEDKLGEHLRLLKTRGS